MENGERLKSTQVCRASVAVADGLSEVVVDEAAKSAVLGDPAHRSLI